MQRLMHRPLLLALSALLALFAGASTGTAQVKAPAAGKAYKETTSLGFQIKAPKRWEVTPPGPEDGNLVAAYFPPRGSGYLLGGRSMEVGFWMVLFDTSVTDEQRAAKRIIKYSKDAESWIDSNVLGSGWKVMEGYPDEKFKCRDKDKKFFGKATIYKGRVEAYDVRCFCVEYKLDENKTLAVIANGPGDKKKWKAWEKGIKKMMSSFERIELETAKAGKDAKGLVGPRLEKYNEIVAKLPAGGGWEVYVSPNYFVVSNSDDKLFIKDVQRRLEAIRTLFLEDFPVEKAFKGHADPLHDMPEGLKEELEKMDEEAKEKAIEEWMNRSKTVGDGLDPAIRSTMSVVKIFQDRASYLDYGAPAMSAGYWWSLTEELCLYDDKVQGRNATFGTLFHEAFHQYMFYYCGGMKGVDLHGWFDEGTADYYAGYEVRGKKARPGESKRRLQTIQDMIKSDDYAPIETFINWYQREYYGTNDLGIGMGQNYAHGWSFVNFLKRGAKEKPKGWQKEWADLIPTYLQISLETGDSKKAIEESFGTVDLDALETCWKEFTL